MVTKKEFENAYRKFMPSKFEAFYIKNISASSLSDKIGPAILISICLILPFIASLLCKFLNLPHFIILATSIIYANILATLGLVYCILTYRRKKRIRNICNELRIYKKRYNEIVHKYYYENYYPDIKDYINHIIDSSTNNNLRKNK